jgi:hypothetical protein
VALKEVTAMSCHLLASLELDHIKALHDFVVVQLSKSGAVNDELFVDCAPSADNFVVVFIFADDYVGVKNVSNFVKKLGLFCVGLGTQLLLLVHLFVASLALSDFFLTFVSSFAVLLLLRYKLADVILILLKLTQFVRGCNLNKLCTYLLWLPRQVR